MSSATLDAEAIVQIWERGRREHAVDRALTILSVLSRRPRRELAEISLERRDNLLLAWRAHLFGARLAGYGACPRCGCGVEFSLTADGLDAPEDEPFVVEAGGARLAVRMPTSLDLAAAATCESVEAARHTLLRRCVDGLPAGNRGPDGGGAPDGDEVMAAVEAELDRRAGVSGRAVESVCPDCEHHWSLELDVAAFVWREIEILAARLLRDVDVLARRYGWSEREILALGAARRRFYLELAA